MIKDPLAIHPWRFPFQIGATVFYVTEPFPEIEIKRLCTQLRLLTLKDIDNPHHFLVLFPNNSLLLFLSPQKGICDGCRRSELSPELKLVWQHVINTVNDLITYCKKEGVLRKEQYYYNGNNKTAPVR
jgi:hypothetical protein